MAGNMDSMNSYNLGAVGPQGTPGGDAVGCLSQQHIRAQHLPEIPARLEICTRATYARVQRELVEKPCAECGQVFLVEKYRSSMVNVCRTCRGVGGTRGDVTRFSQESRRRLMRILNQVQKSIDKVSFVTLTFPDEFHEHIENPEEWKNRLRLFEWRFRRAFPEGSFVWRLETIERKSGDYVGESFPHYHLLVFNIPTQKLRPFVIENWHEIAGCGNSEHLQVLSHKKSVTPVLSRRGVLRYASKAVGSVMSSELAKSLQAAGTHVGRWWGIANRDIFKMFLDVPEVYEMTDGDAVQIMRVFRRLIRLNGRSPRSLVCFLDGETLQKNLLRLLSLAGGKWQYEPTKRPYNVPFWKWAYEKGLLVPR